MEYNLNVMTIACHTQKLAKSQNRKYIFATIHLILDKYKTVVVNSVSSHSPIFKFFSHSPSGFENFRTQIFNIFPHGWSICTRTHVV